MGPDEDRAVRREALAREVRLAVIELTDNDPVRMTSIPEVVRRLGVSDTYLLGEALEIARGRGWMTVAGGMIKLIGRAPADQAQPRALAPLFGRDARRATVRRRKRARERRAQRRRAGR